MIDVEDIKEWRGGGAMCPCGGPISKGAVIGGERWNCRACGRYEVMRGVSGKPEPEGDGSAHLVE
jgi:hypothetical protein